MIFFNKKKMESLEIPQIRTEFDKAIEDKMIEFINTNKFELPDKYQSSSCFLVAKGKSLYYRFLTDSSSYYLSIRHKNTGDPFMQDYRTSTELNKQLLVHFENLKFIYNQKKLDIIKDD